nr:DNA translocase FtsK [Pseudomonas otitidis]
MDSYAGVGDDPLLNEAIDFVRETRRASISAVQRKLAIGYNRAARLIEDMERLKVISPIRTDGFREVLAHA